MFPLGAGAEGNPSDTDGFWRENGFSGSGPRSMSGFGGELMEPSKMLLISPGSAVLFAFGDVETLAAVGSFAIEDVAQWNAGRKENAGRQRRGRNITQLGSKEAPRRDNVAHNL